MIRFLREVLSENGVGSLSRTGSAVIVCAYSHILTTTRAISERSEELAFVLGALYGVNELKGFGQWLAKNRPQATSVDGQS